MPKDDIPMNDCLLQLNGVSYAYSGKKQNSIENIHFHMKNREIIALLGKSGSGKSTLLRVIAGLKPATQGQVFYKNQLIQGPVYGIAMVFQNFALLPWMTVLENVELGLTALNMPKKERRIKALKAIDAIGLDGFESAYPKELSGGMRQRVGFARALVMDPDVLLMDEPFSALDVLTADNLKDDLMELWQNGKANTKGILLVTHHIEEAVDLADRVVILDSNPGRVRAELVIDLPRPRDKTHHLYQHLVDRIYGLMTIRSVEDRHDERTGSVALPVYRLPAVAISVLSGFIDTIYELEQNDFMDLPDIAEHLNLHVNDLFPIIEALDLLALTRSSGGDIILTEQGLCFAKADMLLRKKIFAQQLTQKVALAQHIMNALESSHHARLSYDKLIDLLKEMLEEKEAKSTLRTMIDWGRYAEIFEYDDKTEMLTLESEE